MNDADLEPQLVDLWWEGEVDHGRSVADPAVSARRVAAGRCGASLASRVTHRADRERHAARRARRRCRRCGRCSTRSRPRYDLVNRIMTFRLDVRWRRRAVRDLAWRPGRPGARPRLGHRRPLHRPAARAGHRPISIDLSFGMLAADRSARRECRATSLRLPVPDGVGRRRDVRVRPAQPRRPRGVLPRAGPGRPPGRPDRAARRRACRANTVIRLGHGVYFGKVVPRSGALLSDGAAYRYLPKSGRVPPGPGRDAATLRRAGFADAPHRLLSGGITQLLTGTRGRGRRTGHDRPERSAARERRRPERRRRWRRLPVRARGAGLAGRGVAAGCRSTKRSASSRAIERDDEVGARQRPDRVRRAPVHAGRRGDARGPLGRGRQSRRRTGLGHTASTARRPAAAHDLASRSRARRRYHSARS